METKWKARTTYVDEETGEVISPDKINNYTITDIKKQSYVQNGHGTIEYTKFARRIYNRDLFSEGTNTQ